MSNSTFLFPPVDHHHLHHLMNNPNNNSVLDFDDQLFFYDNNNIYDLGWFDDDSNICNFTTASAEPIMLDQTPLMATSSHHHHHHHQQHDMASGSSGSSASASSVDSMSMNKYPMKMKYKGEINRIKREEGNVVAFRTKTKLETLDDGYKWRKYGKKMVKSNPNPRNYYKCSSVGCKVKKRIERDREDYSYLITTYEGIHNHQSPCSIIYSHNLPFSLSHGWSTLQPL